MNKLKISGATFYGVELYAKCRKAEARMNKLSEEINAWMKQIPEDEMGEYVRLTTEIDSKEEDYKKVIQVSWRFYPEQVEFVKKQAEKEGISEGEVVRHLVAKAMSGSK